MKLKKKYNSLVFLYFLSLTFCSDDVRYPTLESPNDPEIPNEKLRIIQPKGGDTLWVDSNFNIVWESDEEFDYDTPLNIEYSTDSGLNWKLIDSNYLLINYFYSWLVPQDTSDYVKLKLSHRADSSISAMTDGHFSIKVRSFNIEDIDLESLKYYPLSIGDFWIYELKHSGWYHETYNYIVKKIVLGDTIVANKRYLLVNEIPIVEDSTIFENSKPYSWKGFQILDSLNCRLIYGGSVETGKYSVDLSMSEGDIETSNPYEAYWEIILQKEDTLDVLNTISPVKQYQITNIYERFYYYFTKNIGVYRFRQLGEGTDYDMILKGAKIGDVVIGDTTTVN